MIAPPKWVELKASIDANVEASLRSGRRALFLADGARNPRGLAEATAAAWPRVLVVKTDLGLADRGAFPPRPGARLPSWAPSPGPIHAPNLGHVVMDNTKRMPHPDASFDTIVLQNGLCLCHSKTRTCSGVVATASEATDFLREVARLLNRNNPSAYALLDGSLGNTPATLQAWERAAAQVMREMPDVHVKIERYTSVSKKVEFYGISMRPAPKP